jgi:NAD(P)-dependent dehydrogenase (short-subunit alcohol dehydrogenase family)
MSGIEMPLAVVTGGAGGIGRAVTAQLTRDGHRVLAVDLLGDAPMAGRVPADRAAAYRERIPQARFGEPAEVAAAICYLAGPGASYVTASVLDVNGGLH